MCVCVCEFECVCVVWFGYYSLSPCPLSVSEGFRLELTDADDAIAVDTGQWTNRAFVSHKWPYYVYVLLCCVANGVVEDMDMDPREGEREGGGRG